MIVISKFRGFHFWKVGW